MQVLSNSVANALRLTVGQKAEETARFAHMFDKFFDCLNCSTLSAGKRSRNPFKSPFRSGTDWKLKVLLSIHMYSNCCTDVHVQCDDHSNRVPTYCFTRTYKYVSFLYMYIKYGIILILQWLTDVFLPYLDEWEKSVGEREGFTRSEKGMMLLSNETRLGLRITGKFNDDCILVGLPP